MQITLHESTDECKKIFYRLARLGKIWSTGILLSYGITFYFGLCCWYHLGIVFYTSHGSNLYGYWRYWFDIIIVIQHTVECTTNLRVNCALSLLWNNFSTWTLLQMLLWDRVIYIPWIWTISILLILVRYIWSYSTNKGLYPYIFLYVLWVPLSTME
jgi:hypothetical protein